MSGALLDTCALVEAERGRLDLARFFTGTEPAAISAVTAHEMLRGVARLPQGVRRARSERWLETILAAIPILEYDLEVARVHSALWVELAANRVTMAEADQMIAATAITHGLDLVTSDAAFRHVPDLKLRTW